MHTTTSTPTPTTQASQPAVVDTTDRIPLAADALHLVLSTGRTRVTDRVAMRIGLWLILWGSRGPRRERTAPAESALRSERIRATARAERDRAHAHLALHARHF